MTPEELRQAVRASNQPISRIAAAAGIANSTLYSFISGASGSLRASAHAAVEQAVLGTLNGVSEERSNFDHHDLDLHPSVLEEANKLGVNVAGVARKAVEDAVKRARIDAWIEENKEAFAANARDVEENGLWCDRYRLF